MCLCSNREKKLNETTKRACKHQAAFFLAEDNTGQGERGKTIREEQKTLLSWHDTGWGMTLFCTPEALTDT